MPTTRCRKCAASASSASSRCCKPGESIPVHQRLGAERRPVGTMKGTYQMVAEDGTHFDAEIPEFVAGHARAPCIEPDLSLKHSYTLIAPFYDAAIARATQAARPAQPSPPCPKEPGRVLLAGVGTGLDLPHLPPQHQLRRSRPQPGDAAPRLAACRTGRLRAGSGRCPAPAVRRCQRSTCAVLHLILAVVPEPAECFAEIARILRPGGQVLVFDKFLRHGQTGTCCGAWPTRCCAGSPPGSMSSSKTLLAQRSTQAWQVEHDRPALVGGWFRMIRLQQALRLAARAEVQAHPCRVRLRSRLQSQRVGHGQHDRADEDADQPEARACRRLHRRKSATAADRHRFLIRIGRRKLSRLPTIRLHTSRKVAQPCVAQSSTSSRQPAEKHQPRTQAGRCTASA